MKIPVTIIYRSRGEKCEAACGLDWSAAETLKMIKRSVQERFGDAVGMKLVDLSADNPENKRLNFKIAHEGLSLPLLLVDNEVRISGEFDARQLMDAVEAEMELKWKTNTT